MLRKKLLEIVLNCSLRGVLGILAIHFINAYSISKGFPAVVGINFVTVPIMVLFGMPGIGMLYIFGIFW